MPDTVEDLEESVEQMQKLNFQDASFLRMETPQRPFHVGALLILAKSDGAKSGYLRKMQKWIASSIIANEPLFNRQLADPNDLRNPSWVETPDLDLAYHLRHYALPLGGRMQDLMRLIAHAHSPSMNRNMPLWEYHLIDGLPKNRFESG